MLSELDKRLISALQTGLPLVPRPFAVIGDELGLKEQDVLTRIKDYRDKGYLKRLGAAIRHQRVGFTGNALVAWQVPEERIVEVGTHLGRADQVTHCYQRTPRPDWPYNLYTMVHKPTREECRQLVEKLATEVRVGDYLVLFSDRELKRTSMTYFAAKG